MEKQCETESMIEAMDGGHLHWLNFRENVLQPFRIRCSPKARSDRLPTTFLARLQASQSGLEKYDTQKNAWRQDVVEGRGLNQTPLFPPHLVPPSRTAAVRRVMSPRMSREDLPLKVPSPRGSLYELPTAKPAFVSGFNMELFEKTEQAHLGGGLSVNGTVVDFEKAEVLPGKSAAVPFLAFHKFDNASDSEIESARNACAISGAQCLRSQQQLLHKAFGLQQISDPPITFTTALNNHQAIVNCHYVDDDGSYVMAPLCKFDLDQDDHFVTFQAWLDAIESWAFVYLLPRVRGAIGEISRSNPSPPPSPVPLNSGLLSIDTNSDSVVAILSALRRIWPSMRWQNDSLGETPINSSIAQCGTPLNARKFRGFTLSAFNENLPTSLAEQKLDIRPTSSMSQRMADLAPIRTDVPLSARPLSRQSLHQRRFSTTSSMRSRSDGSMTPNSPCRPPSLSPCTPGPEAPVSAKSPMLVLQRRLDVAMGEIQELKVQVEDLQGQLNGRTEVLEKRLEAILERQDEHECQPTLTSGPRKRGGSSWARSLEKFVEEDSEIKSPIAQASFRNFPQMTPIAECVERHSSNISDMPGGYPTADLGSTGESLEDFLVWGLAVLFKDEQVTFIMLMAMAFVMWLTGFVRTGDIFETATVDVVVGSMSAGYFDRAFAELKRLSHAVATYDLEASRAGIGDQCATSPAGETVPIVLV